jgi:hypothetical protein
LAEDQSYLSPDTILDRSLAFLRVSQKISAILTCCENKALKEREPEWLAKLIATWHIRQATVHSFNYGNLIEAAVQTQEWWLGVDVDTILDQQPLLSPNLVRRGDSSYSGTITHAGGYIMTPSEVPPVNTFTSLNCTARFLGTGTMAMTALPRYSNLQTYES